MARNEEFEHGRDHQARAEMGAELFKEALLKQRGLGPDTPKDDGHEHDYDLGKRGRPVSEDCLECGKPNPAFG